MPTKKQRRRQAQRPAASSRQTVRTAPGAQGNGAELPSRPRRAPDNTVIFPTGRADASRPAGPARRRSAPAPSPARREGQRRRRATRKMLRRRRLLRRLTALFFLLCVAVVGVYLTVTMLFKINAIRLVGPDGGQLTEAGPYAGAQILDALGVQLEENIFSFDPAAKAAELEKSFPLLEDIEVRRSYPSTVIVRVTPAEPAYAMQAGAGWLSLSAGMKILSLEADQPELPVLYGGEPVSTTPGEYLSYAAPAAASSAASGGEAQADGRLGALDTLLAALEQRGLLAGVTRLEYADTEQLAFLYQDRISVLLGTLNELDYKLDYAEYMLLNKDGRGCAETDTGSLDCSRIRTDGTLRAIFAQGEPALPSGYSVPAAQPAAQPEAAADETASADQSSAAPAEAQGPAGAQ